MNGKQLKNSILQWAIQGKLVPQDPNDEPASVLLEKIRAEKARLVKEKKIKKDKNESIIFRGDDNSYYEKFLATGEIKCIDEEIPFEIPEGWEWCRVIEVILPPKYGTSSKSLPLGDVPVLRMGNIQNGEIAYDKLVFSDNKSDNEKYDLQKGDLLFNRTNSAELVGKTAIYRGERKSIYAGYLILLRPLFINSDFLNYIFSTPYVRSYCKEVKTIGVQQCNINAEKISDLLIPIAPKEEQMRIVSKIKEVLPKVDMYSKSQEKLNVLNYAITDQIKKSILQEAIQGKLVPQIAEEGTAQELLEQIKQEKQRLVKEGKLKKSALNDSVIFRGDDNKYYERIGSSTLCINDDIPFDIPETWTWCRLGSLFDHNTGKALNAANRDGRLLQYITTSNLYWGFFDLSNVKQMYFKESEIEKCTVRRGDLLVCEGGDIGRAAIWVYDYPMCIQNHIHRLRSFIPLSIEFYYNVFQAYKGIGLIGGKGIGIQGLSAKAIHNILIPLPPINEQYKVVGQVNKLFQYLQ